MIQEDAINFQKQLIHLFRTFEVEADVGLHGNKGDYGCTVISQDEQLVVHPAANTKKRPAKKDVLSG